MSELPISLGWLWRCRDWRVPLPVVWGLSQSPLSELSPLQSQTAALAGQLGSVTAPGVQVTMRHSTCDSIRSHHAPCGASTVSPWWLFMVASRGSLAAGELCSTPCALGKDCYPRLKDYCPRLEQGVLSAENGCF